MSKISTTIIVRNNEDIIERCLKSVAWTDEIIIADSGSTDQTLDICRKYHCKIVETPWLGFGQTKQLAEKHTSHEWVFSIDSDEVCSNTLKEEIQNTLSAPQDFAGFKIKRRTFYLNKPIKYCGWQNDYPLRLYRKSLGGFNSRNIHEFVEVKGDIGKIRALLLHHSYPTIEGHIEKINRYTTLGAQEAVQKGKTCSPFMAVLKGSFKFLKMFILQWGFLDGLAGFLLAKNSSFGVYLKYLKIYEFSCIDR